MLQLKAYNYFQRTGQRDYKLFVSILTPNDYDLYNFPIQRNPDGSISVAFHLDYVRGQIHAGPKEYMINLEDVQLGAPVYISIKCPNRLSGEEWENQRLMSEVAEILGYEPRDMMQRQKSGLHTLVESILWPQGADEGLEKDFAVTRSDANNPIENDDDE